MSAFLSSLFQSDTFLTNHQNAAQRVLDGMNCVIQSVSEYSTGPTKAVAAWVTDQVAPPYWRPNTEITVSTKSQRVETNDRRQGLIMPPPPPPHPSPQACHGCRKVFEEAERKHHCRSCGEGFCHPCSSHRMPVPERGWGSAPVRVCKACYQQGGPADTNSQGNATSPNDEAFHL